MVQLDNKALENMRIEFKKYTKVMKDLMSIVGEIKITNGRPHS